jgi:hypothetical protein
MTETSGFQGSAVEDTQTDEQRLWEHCVPQVTTLREVLPVACTGSLNIFPSIIDLGTRWRCVVN